jgi:fructosamine-3-kinase
VIGEERARVEAVVGAALAEARPLTGGCVGEVYLVVTGDGRELVAKVDAPGSDVLEVEGRMLQDLADCGAVPVPAVIGVGDGVLVMEHVAHDGQGGGDVQVDLARCVAALHDLHGEAFGYSYDTVIGGLPQPNPRCDSWIEFFRLHRLEAMATQAFDAGRLPEADLERVRALGARLEEWLDEPDHPSLLHGDLWGGNVLMDRGKVAALIDPAIYHGHPEVELAFGTMFGTLGPRFFDEYRRLRELRDGFFETRRDLYNLYPLLVHVRLFGGSYLASLRATLKRFEA